MDIGGKSRPELAVPDDDLIGILTHIAKNEKNELVIVSGRTKKDLDEWRTRRKEFHNNRNRSWYKEFGSVIEKYTNSIFKYKPSILGMQITPTGNILLQCRTEKEDLFTDDQAVVDYGLLQTLPVEPISFTDEVQPVLDKRCVVCHGCYDAPCQLKLSSIAGIRRGANEEKVYNGSRIKTMQPSRLGIDAKLINDWRDKNFYPVLNENPMTTENPRQNLQQSTLYQMLRLKQLHPQSRAGRLESSPRAPPGRASRRLGWHRRWPSGRGGRCGSARRPRGSGG